LTDTALGFHPVHYFNAIGYGSILSVFSIVCYQKRARFNDEKESFAGELVADEADALAGRAKTVAAQHYVLHDLQLFADKYVKAWALLRLS
jgi:hypothetical protein